VQEDFLFALRNEDSQSPRGDIDEVAAIRPTGKAELQKGVGGVRLYISSVQIPSVFQHMAYRSVPP
jgi:hypothetical protein